ncbi:MAG: GOLPH3/VPS74 family protein [Chloroflexota bacterium]
MISLPEELLLLAIDDATGKIHSSGPSALDYGLAGAVLMDLLLADRLALADGKLTLADSTPIGDPVLDDAALEVGQNAKVGDARYWVDKLGRDHLEERVLERLLEQRILRKDEHRILWVIPIDRYPIVNPSPERETRERIRAAVLDGTAPESRIAALIGLMKACNLTTLIFTRDEQRAFGRRIDQIAHGDAVGQAVSRAAEAAQAAMTAAIAASIATSVATSTAACSASTTSACNA